MGPLTTLEGRVSRSVHKPSQEFPNGAASTPSLGTHHFIYSSLMFFVRVFMSEFPVFWIMSGEHEIFICEFLNCFQETFLLSVTK